MHHTENMSKVTSSLINTGKKIDKILCPFMRKTFNKLEIGGIYLKIIKAVYPKPTANKNSIGKDRAFPLKSGTKQVLVAHSHYYST